MGSGLFEPRIVDRLHPGNGVDGRYLDATTFKFLHNDIAGNIVPILFWKKVRGESCRWRSPVDDG
jgi:hypothetical protein